MASNPQYRNLQDQNPQYHQLPIADLKRRVGASAIDYILAWLAGGLGGSVLGPGFGQWLVFLMAWFVLRVLVVMNNRGQSPGHWALDMKVVNEASGKMPSLEWLARREGSIGFACSLLFISIHNPNYLVILFVLALPIGYDLWIASVDRELGQTLHDRLGRTVVINTLRGYSLDLKLRDWFEAFRERSRKY